MMSDLNLSFRTQRLGPASTLCDRLLEMGLSVDRSRIPSGFRVQAVGTLPEGLTREAALAAATLDLTDVEVE